MPHNFAIATLGVFILWIGWYGFNPGSQLAFSSAADVDATVLIAVNTTLAAGAGVLLAMIMGWLVSGKPDLGYALNGALAGLVGITANCDGVTNGEAMFIGAIAGVLVVLGMLLLERMRIDDPVGAWPVHGLCGVWGGIAGGIFGSWGPVAEGSSIIYGNMTAQIVGSIAIPLWAFGTALVLFLVIKALGILRVSPEDEQMGLDVSEHGSSAYGMPGGVTAFAGADD